MHKYVFDIYILFGLLFNMRSILYQQGSIFSKIIFAVNLILTLYFSVRAFLDQNKPKTLKYLSVFVVVLTFYGLIFGLQYGTATVQYTGAVVNTSNYLTGLWSSLLPIFAVYYLTVSGYFSVARFRVWIVVFFIASIFTYQYYQQVALDSLIAKGSDRDEVTNNSGYLFATLIPLFIVYKNKPLYQYIGIALCLLFTIFAMKRGAIVVSLVAALMLIITQIKVDRNKKKYMFFSFFLCVFAYFLISYMIENSDYFMMRFYLTLEGDSSNRDVLWGEIFQYLKNDLDLFSIFFGDGAYATIRHCSNYAHNDWLELAVNQGVLGVLLYFIFYKSLYKAWKYETSPDLKTTILTIFLILLTRSAFSMSYGNIPFALSVFFGYCMACSVTTINKREFLE